MIAKFRQEHKYRISLQNLALLRHKLRWTLRTDDHAGPDGGYWIRSLYFDDRDYTALREKLDGVKERSKYRLRYYNFDDSYIVLEKKERNGDLCRKSSQRVSREMAERIVAGQRSGGDAPLLLEFDAMVSRGLHPVVIVDYHRYAYSHPISDTRVTLDSHLKSPIYSLDFFNKELACFPVFEEDEGLIEVKFDHFAPPNVTFLLEGIPKIKLAVSKFARCLSMIEE